MDDVEAVISEAGRIAGEVIAPLNRDGDHSDTAFKDGVVTTAPGWKEAYHAWCKAGWNGLASPTEWVAKGCRKSSTRRARRCGTPLRWRSASVRC